MHNRIEYIDAMRGFAMFLVVFVHIEIFCFFNFSYHTFLGSLIILIHMPLFFFISGVVAYNTSLPNKVKINEKIRTLIIPMLFFGLLYTYLVSQKNIILFIQDSAKIGYWFTLVLLEIYLIYYASKILTKKLKVKNNSFWLWSLVILSIVLYICKYPMRIIAPLDYIGGVFSLHYTMNFLQFFVLGLLYVHYREKVNKIICNIGTLSILLLLFVSVVIAYYKYSMWDPFVVGLGSLGKVLSTLLGTFCSYCAIIGIFLLFRKKQNRFSLDNKKTKYLIKLGRRTLDVYLLHYFIIGIISLYEYDYIIKNNILSEITIISIFTIIVIFLSFLISSILRKNRTIAKYLLGVKFKQ